MSLPAAEGAITLAESYLAASFAACARWQAWCGADDADEALESIYFDDLPPPPEAAKSYTREQLDSLRPYILIYSDEQTGVTWDHQSHSTGFGFRDNGTLKGFFEAAVDPQIAHDQQRLFRQFKNDVGVLVDELLALAGLAGYLAISTLSLYGPIRSHNDQQPGEGDYVQMMFTITWGRR